MRYERSTVKSLDVCQFFFGDDFLRFLLLHSSPVSGKHSMFYSVFSEAFSFQRPFFELFWCQPVGESRVFFWWFLGDPVVEAQQEEKCYKAVGVSAG